MSHRARLSRTQITAAGIVLLATACSAETTTLGDESDVSKPTASAESSAPPASAQPSLAPAGPTSGDRRVIAQYWEMYPDFARDEFCRLWRVEKVTDSDREFFAEGFAEPMAEDDYELIRPDQVTTFTEYWVTFLDEQC